MSDARKEAEWDALCERALGDGATPRDMERAIRWLLIECFGDERMFLYDATFHARVVAAEQMLRTLREPSWRRTAIDVETLRRETTKGNPAAIQAARDLGLIP